MRALALAAAAAAASAAPAITPDPSSRFGVWQGWGVSLAWYANAFGARDDVVGAFFSTGNVTVTLGGGATVALPGLAFSIARYNVGACSDDVVGGQRIALSPNIPAFKRIDAYWPTPGALNASADAGQVAHLLLARSKYNCKTVELFSNSPPWYMTTNANPSGSNDGTSDNLQAAQRAAHAAYMAAVAAHFRDAHGVTPDTVEPFNEVRRVGGQQHALPF
jgi:galactan endo-1,6-beta-galactosidase